MSIYRSLVACGLVLGCIALTASVCAADTNVTDYLYITDYGQKTLDRFSFTYDQTTNQIVGGYTPDGAGNSSTTSVLIAGGGVQEGIMGTTNDLLVVGNNNASVVRYNLAGVAVGLVNLTHNGSAYTLNGVGNMVITPDGNYLYVAEASGNFIDKIDLRTGIIVTQVPFQGAHDLVLNIKNNTTYTLYAAAYSGNSTSGANQSNGVWSFDQNLGSKTQLIASGANGLSTPTGMTFVPSGGTGAGTLYVNNNGGQNGSGSVQIYTINTSNVAAFVSSTTPSGAGQQVFSFGSSLGPDGNVYVAGLGSGQTIANFPVPAGYTNGIYEFNTTTDASTLAVAGWNATTGAPASKFDSPKYLEFNTDFIGVGDQGFTPEPGGGGLLGGLVTSAALFIMKRRRRTA